MLLFLLIPISFSCYICGVDQVPNDFIEFFIKYIEEESTNGCNTITNTNSFVNVVDYSTINNIVQPLNNNVNFMQNINNYNLIYNPNVFTYHYTKSLVESFFS
jgi:hypothetical protein